MHSFNPRQASFTSPLQFFPNGQPTLALRNKLRVGTAFVLSYFEHGTCLWLLVDEPRGVLAGDWYWDGQDVASVLTWEHPVAELGTTSLEDRLADARLFLQTYTSWCNGETYGSAGTIQLVTYTSTLQSKLPNDQIGRITAMIGLVSTIFIPLGLATAGLLADTFGTSTVNAAGAVIALLAAAGAYAVPDVRRLEVGREPNLYPSGTVITASLRPVVARECHCRMTGCPPWP